MPLLDNKKACPLIPLNEYLRTSIRRSFFHPGHYLVDFAVSQHLEQVVLFENFCSKFLLFGTEVLGDFGDVLKNHIYALGGLFSAVDQLSPLVGPFVLLLDASCLVLREHCATHFAKLL